MAAHLGNRGCADAESEPGLSADRRKRRRAGALGAGVALSVLATFLPGQAGADPRPFAFAASLYSAELPGGGITNNSVLMTPAQVVRVGESGRRYRSLEESGLIIHQPAPPPPPPPPPVVPFSERPVDQSVGVFIPAARVTGIAAYPNAKAGWSATSTLTFDDCASAPQMQAVVDALAQVRRPGIFFITGQCRDHYPWLVDALIGAGHQVCNHTYSHANLTKLTDAGIRAQIGGGVWAGCPYFRPPFGATDWRVAQIAREYGLTQMLWDVDSRDWAGASSEAMAAVARARGGVILFHLHGFATADAIRLLG